MYTTTPLTISFLVCYIAQLTENSISAIPKKSPTGHKRLFDATKGQLLKCHTKNGRLTSVSCFILKKYTKEPFCVISIHHFIFPSFIFLNISCMSLMSHKLIAPKLILFMPSVRTKLIILSSLTTSSILSNVESSV